MALLNDRILVTISAASEGAVRELQDLEKSAKGSDDAVLNLGKSLKTGLVAGAAALAGTGLVSFLNDSAQAFIESQDAALQFARATNATVEEAGKFTSVARTLGLDMNDLIEINAEFSKKIAEQPQLLEDLNVQVSKNADGSVNMTRTLVDTIDALGSMEDGLKAAQIAAEVFGEEGSKQLAGFYLQGIEVADLMDRIDFVDQSEQAKRFAGSTIEMKLAMQQFQTVLGAEIVPLMTTLLDVGTGVLGFMSQLPVEVYLAVGAFTALRVVSSTGLFAGLASSLAATATGFAILSRQVGITAAAWKGLTGVLAANPITAALVVLTAGYTAFSIAADNAKDRAEDFVVDMERNNSTLQETAEAMLETASAAERFSVAWENTGGAVGGPVIRLFEGLKAIFDDNEALDDYRAYLERIREEMGPLGIATANAEEATFDLNTEIAKLVQNSPEASYKNIAEAAADAAAAQRQQEEITRLAGEAMRIAAGDAAFFIEELGRLENIGGSSVEALKQSLEGISFEDVGDTWANELTIAKERAYDTLATGLTEAVEFNPQLDISAWLNQFRGLSPELDAVIDQLLSDVGSDANIQAALEVAKGKSVDEAKTELDTLGEPVDTTLDVTTTFAPDGYNALKARKDYLAEAVDSDLVIDVSFSPGGYLAAKARKDYLSQDTTSYIDVVLRGAYSASLQLASLRQQAVVEAQVAAAPIQAATPVVNNAVTVDLDGFQLRSVVREEVRFNESGEGGLP